MGLDLDLGHRLTFGFNIIIKSSSNINSEIEKINIMMMRIIFRISTGIGTRKRK